MKNDQVLRQTLLGLLTGNDAHANFEAAVRNMPANVRGLRPDGAAHSPWEVLEHMRITQQDILEFSRKAGHQSPEFPKGYWPATQQPPTEKAWDESVKAFQKDLREFCDLVSDENADLHAKIPHGEGQTLLREALLAADHTSYHLGELVVLRRLLGVWPEA